MIWTLDGTAVMRGDRVVKQCATVEDANAYVAELTGSVVQIAAGKPKPKAKMGKNGKPLPPWLQPKNADDDADDAPAAKK
jgi:hypothetical protein